MTSSSDFVMEVCAKLCDRCEVNTRGGCDHELDKLLECVNALIPSSKENPTNIIVVVENGIIEGAEYTGPYRSCQLTVIDMDAHKTGDNAIKTFPVDIDDTADEDTLKLMEVLKINSEQS